MELNKRLKVLFICSWYPSREHRTIGNFIQRHALAVAKYHDITVVYATESHENNIEVVENGGLIEHLIYFKKTIPALSYQKSIRSHIKKLQKEQNFDIAHIHVAYPAILAVPILKMPYIITEHFSGYHKISGFQWGAIKKKLSIKYLNKAKAILPVSNHLAKAIQEFAVQNKFIKISNVVDIDSFYPREKKSEIFRFLHVSSLEERSKNISGILKGFKELYDLGFDFILQIGGDGDLDELKKKIADVGLKEDCLEIFGESSAEQISEMMRKAHCLVMFSHFENQPCTILEALCSGIPVISSNVGGISEEINEENGILVPSGDMLQFVQSLKAMVQNYSDFDLKSIAQIARNKYSNDSIAKEISAVYFNVLNIDS